MYLIPNMIKIVILLLFSLFMNGCTHYAKTLQSTYGHNSIAVANADIMCDGIVGIHSIAAKKGTKFRVLEMGGQEYKHLNLSCFLCLDIYTYPFRERNQFPNEVLYLPTKDGFGVDRGFIINPAGDWAFESNPIAQVDLFELWTLFEGECKPKTFPFTLRNVE